MLKSKNIWKVNETEIVPGINQNLSLHPVVQKLILNRELTKPENLEAFLEEEPFHDPFKFEEMDKVVARIQEAIEFGQPILIYGDYDADGVTGTSILVRAITELGGMVEYYIPNRFSEGYGPNEDAFMQAVSDGFELVITVDNGISGISEAAVLKQHDVDLIITDHHQRKDELPDVFAIIHPEIDETYPFHKLCGAGVALKLAQALLQDKLSEDYYAIAMMGTIGDVVPLIDENRSIVKRGLRQLRVTQDEGLLKLIELTGSAQDQLDEVNVGFELCPRLNAPGRMEDAGLAVELLISQDYEVAHDIGDEIQRLNETRKTETQKVLTEAMSLISEQELKCKKVILLHQPHWHEGILGIVAGRLARMWGKAVFVLSDDHDGGIKGSARAIEGYHLFDLLNKCEELIEKFGGHALAAGVSFRHDNFEALDQLMNSLLQDTEIQPVQPIDLSLELSDIDLTLVEQFEQLAPFGEGNRPPVIKLNQVQVKDVKCIGNKSQHLKFVATTDDKTKIDIIGFNMSEWFVYLTPDTTFDLVGELKINEWNGNRSIQLQLLDMKCDEFQVIDLRNKQTFESNKAYIEDMVQYTKSKEVENTQSKNLLIDQLPDSLESLFTYIKTIQPDNVILGPLPSQVTFPARDKFVKVFKAVKQQKTFSLTPEVYGYFHNQGISKNELLFILQVFFEVELVIIRNGSVISTDSSHKRDLSEAPLYKTQAEKVKTLEFFELSTWREIKTAFINAREENSYES